MPFLTTADGDLHYDIIDQTSPWVSQPETIVFHHGLGACGACWRGWYPTLLSHYRLVVFDMCGHGSSQTSGDGSLETLVNQLDAVVCALNNNSLTKDSTKAGKIHLVGESIGGTIAIAYAARHADQLLSLTVSNGAHYGGSLDNLANWQEIVDKGGMQAWSDHMMTLRFNDDELTSKQRLWYQQQQATADQHFVLSAVQQLLDADLSEELSAIRMPVLLLHPDNSPFIPLEVTLDLLRKLPSAQLRVFADTRHGLPFGRAQDCAGELLRFLKTLA